MHEAQLHDSNWFATLTYKVDPRSLQHEDMQLFFKRLRKIQPIRYFMCGEYGETYSRPHYHAILFGLQLNDLKVYSENHGNTLYESPMLTKVWGLGHINVGRVTVESANYVASYCTKKVTGDKATDHYERLELETGELYALKPEYAKMSLKPAIASQWLKKYGTDVFNHDHVIVSGRAQRPPRYYDKYLDTIDAEKLIAHKLQRALKSKLTAKENTKQRLKAIETYSYAQFKQRTRTL
ncbi:MAG: replication initiator protein [Microviridae sp.]|nr:MAG: replication initiator protein [Microviridae sp.]